MRRHKWTDCTNATKQCINCTRTNKQHSDYRTVAAKCPYRKSTIDAKLQRTTDKISTEQQQTYSDIAREAVRQVKTDKTPRPTITFTDKTNLKMTALILEAHIACINSDNDFGQTLSKSLKLNFDIDAKFPDRD